MQPDETLTDFTPPEPKTSQSTTQFPIIGIGASAGGLRALQMLLAHMPAESAMAFVIIMHLSPDYESNLAQLLQYHTRMPVLQVKETVKVAPNHVYIIPPTQHLLMVDGMICLLEPEPGRNRHAPIDLFFRTLAETHASRAGVIVLSGSGSDGMSGLQRVKEHNGLTIVQEPSEAEFDSMPRSAIGTGLVDFVLPVGEIPAALVAYWRNAEQVHLPTADALQSDTNALRALFTLLQTRTGHDFSQYRPATVLRRIGRRMQVVDAIDLHAYLTILYTNPEEVQALLRDLLISVTNFFRNQEAWEALEMIIPSLFANKVRDDHVRVWVAACATGEEAYSTAILLYEYAQTLEHPPIIQVFATDIDEKAIAKARQGLYPQTIAADITPERLERFFTVKQKYYQIKEEIRDLVLFAVHNVLRDPPFSRLDLITCRNLLIYLNRDVQAQVLQLFHFTLRANGYLLLGTSETIDNVPNLFIPLDKTQRLFERRTMPPNTATFIPSLPLLGPRYHPSRVAEHNGVEQNIHSFSDLDLQLLTRYAPPSVILNEQYDIVHLARGAGRFLQLADGEPSHNLLKAVHPSIRLDLRSTLLAAFQQSTRTKMRYVQIDVDGTQRLVNIQVEPITTPEWARGYLLVIFNDIIQTPQVAHSALSDAEPVVRQLEQELQQTRTELRATIEQYETAVEEHKASNEELQTINEELRAATEELETSKEELQSVNEELNTVNQELKHKIEEVIQTSNDLQNLMVSTQIGTIFVDRELRIKRYTPNIQTLFNLIPSDINRPLTHITHHLDYDSLAQDAAHVLATLTLIEREVQSTQGPWYLARLQLYRTHTGQIDGVVLTLVDITKRRKIEESLRESESQLNQILQNLPVGVLIADPSDVLVYGNQQTEALFGQSLMVQHGTKTYPNLQLLDPVNGEPYLPEHMPLARTLRTGKIIMGEEVKLHHDDGTSRYAVVNTTLIRDIAQQVTLGLAVFVDITQQKQAEEALRHARDELEVRVQERTAELAELNNALQIEIQQRRNAERARQEVRRQLVIVQEEERRLMALELHDQLGQSLSALRLGLATLETSFQNQTKSAQSIAQLQALAAQIDEDIDRLASELRPRVLDDIGLVPALQQHINAWSQQHHIVADLQVLGTHPTHMSAEIKVVLYRVNQEALTNVLKHANAQQVSVVLRQASDEVQLIVEDNGDGFNPEDIQNTLHTKHLGLLGMQERVTLVGGTLTVESGVGRGTTIYARIPLVAALNKDGSNG